MSQAQQLVEKRCVVCGTDVSGRKRVRDPRGRYYCDHCYGSAAGKDADPSVTVAAPVAAAARRREADAEVEPAGVASQPRPRARRSLLGSLAVVVMTVGAVIGIIYFTVVKRRHEEFKKTLNDAVVATDKTAAIEAELAQQRQEILKLRIMAEKARDGGEHLEAFEMKLSRDRDFNFQQAIDNDPIAGPLARDNSGLKEAIKSPGDYDLLLFLKALPEDRIKPEDRRYLESVRRAIGHYPDKWSTK